MVFASSLLVLALYRVYLINSCQNTDSHTLLTTNNGSIRKSRSLLEIRENENNNTICVTPGCVIAADSILKNMDLSVDPCDDFYQFTCGNFIKDSIHDMNVITQLEFAMASRTNKIKMVLNERIQPDEQKPIKIVKSLFKSCMDREKIEEQGLQPFEKMLKSFGGWPVLEAEYWNETGFTWTESMYKLRMAGYSSNYFMSFSIGTDLNNSTTRFIKLDRAPLGLDPKYLAKGLSNKFGYAYYRYMLDIAELFGVRRLNAIKELKNSLNFEVEFAKISLSEEERQNATKLYYPMNITDLQQKFPSIPWQEYMNKMLNPLTIRQDDIIHVTSPKYLSDLETLLSNTPKRVQANYIFWRATMVSVRFLTEKMKSRQFKYETEIDIETQSERSDECWSSCLYHLNVATMSLYVRRFFGENAQKKVSKIINGIRRENYKILSTIDWMDNVTKEMAIEQAKSMTVEIAYPELLDDIKLNAYYENLEVHEEDYYTLVLKLNKFNIDKKFSKLRQQIANKLDWIDNFKVLSTIMDYNVDDNSINVPAGIMQDTFFSNDRPQYMNYGAIGTLIGKEINHYLAEITKTNNGTDKDFWTPDTEMESNYLKKGICLMEQFYNYTDVEIILKDDNIYNAMDSLFVNNGGLKEAYYAYNAWAKQHDVEPRLPGLQDYTPQQMIWMSAVNAQCFKLVNRYFNSSFIAKYHLIKQGQIISPLLNLDDFSNDFRCPLGSAMNPAEKCRVF
ncbi:neprilysin-2-like isoform X2 [Aphis gossypii]|nr:neprilysin-2-like isoform X2 [Aphis gossypii]